MASENGENVDNTDNVLLCFFLTEAFSTNHSELPSMKYQAVLEDSVITCDVFECVECGFLSVVTNGHRFSTLDNTK